MTAKKRGRGTKLPSVRSQVVPLLKEHPDGLTGDQIAAAIGASPWIVRPRLSELRSDGLIEPTGEQRFGLGASGSTQTVWRAA